MVWIPTHRIMELTKSIRGHRLARIRKKGMDPTSADRRKRKCLVALLIKNKVKTVEEASLVRHLIPASLDFSELAEAVEQSRIALTPKWEKKVNKILDSGWRPSDTPWIEFDDMRLDMLGNQIISYDCSCIVYSPVEIWALMRRKSGLSSMTYVRSLLTDEEFYVKNSTTMLPAGAHSDLVGNRSLTNGSINFNKCNDVFKKMTSDIIPVTPLITKVLATAKYE